MGGRGPRRWTRLDRGIEEERWCGVGDRVNREVDHRGVVDEGGGSSEKRSLAGQAARAACLERVRAEMRKTGEAGSRGYGLRSPDNRKPWKSSMVTRIAPE